jgi:invasion protein IalB
MTLRSAFLTLALVFGAFPALAQSPELIGKYGDWKAFKFTENGNQVCYMVSQPTKAEGNYTKRGDIFALVTHRPSEKTKNVFSYVTGYTYKDGSDVTVDVNNNKFTLFTQKDMAWTPDQASDTKLADSIRKGSKMVVKGTSSRGTKTTDTFSLKGSGGAHDAINKACGV